MHAFSAGSTVLWLNLSLKTVYHSQSMLRELALANYSFKFLHKIQQTHAKRFDWPKHDDIDRVRSTCVFFGPVHLKGNGPFEVIDLEEVKLCSNQLHSGGQKNLT